MTKCDVIVWIENLENQAKESNRFFLERNELYLGKQKLIKYIEDKIEELKDECASFGHLIDRDTIHKYNLQIKLYEDLLERIKSDKYE